MLSIITRLARGGSERRLFDTLAGVEGHHTVIVGRDSDDRQIERLPVGCEVVRLPSLVRSVDQRADSAAMARLVSIARRGRFDVVHTHQAKAGLLGRVAARAAGVGIVYHSASMASFGPGYSRLESEVFARAERLTAPLVTRYFVVGTDLALRLAGNGVAPRALQVVRSSIDLRPFLAERTAARRRDLATRFGADPDHPIVCYVGSLEARKGVCTLPSVVAAAASGAPISLLVAGEGPERDELRAAADGTGVVTRLLGHIPDVPDLMAAADALVLPSSAEGLPQVVVQAAASGLPFAAYDVDGVAEMLGTGSVGASAPLGDRRALASALGGLLAPHPGAGVCRREAPNERPLPDAFWRAWDPAVVAATYGDAYRRDLSARRGR